MSGAHEGLKAAIGQVFAAADFRRMLCLIATCARDTIDINPLPATGAFKEPT